MRWALPGSRALDQESASCHGGCILSKYYLPSADDVADHHWCVHVFVLHLPPISPTTLELERETWIASSARISTDIGNSPGSRVARHADAPWCIDGLTTAELRQVDMTNALLFAALLLALACLFAGVRFVLEHASVPNTPDLPSIWTTWPVQWLLSRDVPETLMAFISDLDAAQKAAEVARIGAADDNCVAIAVASAVISNEEQWNKTEIGQMSMMVTLGVIVTAVFRLALRACQCLENLRLSHDEDRGQLKPLDPR
ncbi:unnamed protein product [Cladocopium goreaui]|uniref:Uncharacterized protein n=1 Tax=Cladocopium goreaui TaxID=2562237 RepID=A0A9P1BK66_9DINO|nr:unnamed protein product [Cladocopium goreaui]